ncbi:MAG: branched-chain amino acid ABC transporter permease [Gammaproteobacteria bacterium]|nr:branched-chain amino acid ABC transporter permease [Gammaproteobacteria bacterium]
MSSEFLQFLLSGITVGAIYALVGLGFSIIYNASHVINFAQGEFVMIGGMGTVFIASIGVPFPVAMAGAVLLAVVIGISLQKLAIERAREASVVTIIIITIGASIFLRGLAGIIWDRNFHSLPAFSGEQPIHVAGAVIVPQSLWILGVTVAVAVALFVFFNRTMIGRAMLGTAHNPLAAKLVGVNTNNILILSFALAAALGAVGGILIAPMAPTHYQVGIMLGLKGFSAAIVGGLGSGPGAMVGGLLVGVAEAMAAGYISSNYKDVVAFVLILLVLFFMPSGLFGKRDSERV